MAKINKIIKDSDFKTKKFFGQNFLTDANMLEKITSLIEIENKNVLEIGSGMGHLTKVICKKAKKIVTIEIDNQLINFLQKELCKFNNVKLINADFLAINIKELINEHFDSEKVIVVANLPYYITSKIILKLLANHSNFSALVLMMQKEVAQRLTALPNNKKYNNLSIMCQYYSTAKIAVNLSPKLFFPPPKVTSSVVVFQIKDPELRLKEPEKFWKFVRNCFALKRKTLINNLATLINKNKAVEIVNKLEWPLTIRAENLSFLMFYKLFNEVLNLMD